LAAHPSTSLPWRTHPHALPVCSTAFFAQLDRYLVALAGEIAVNIELSRPGQAELAHGKRSMCGARDVRFDTRDDLRVDDRGGEFTPARSCPNFRSAGTWLREDSSTAAGPGWGG